MMQTPALTQLMGTYFHQDWDLFGTSHMDVVDQFAKDAPELAAVLPGEIDHLLNTVGDDAELDDCLDAMGCEVLISPAQGGYRQWLADIAAHVRGRLPHA